MAENTKVFTGEIKFTTNIPSINKEIDGLSKTLQSAVTKMNGAKLAVLGDAELKGISTNINSAASSIDKLASTAEAGGRKMKSSLATLPETMDNIVKSGGASTSTLKNQLDGLYLTMNKNGNAAQGVREIFFGTASSSNFFAQKLDALAQKSISFGNSQTRLQSQMEGVANTADRSARAMALSGKAFQATVYESLGPGSAQMVQPFLQQINRARIAVEGVGKAASAGKDTANSLRQAQIAVKGLQNEYELLTSAGIIKSGTAADIAFKKMIAQAETAKSQVQAMSARYEQTKKNIDGTKKSVDAASVANGKFGLSFKSVTSTGEQQNTVLNKINLSLGNLVKGFRGLITVNTQTSSQLQQLGQTVTQLEKRTVSFGSIASKVFGGAFWGSALGTITGQLMPALFSKFYELNSLIQNTEISIDKMLTGSGVNAQEAISGFTQYIQQVVAKTPFEMADAIDVSMRMVRQGFDPQVWLTPVADVAAAMNKPMEQIVGAMTKMAAGAKGMAVDMFRDVGISVNNVSAVYDKSTKKAVGFKEAQEASALSAADFAKKYEKVNWQFDKSGSLIQGTGDAMEILNGYFNQSPMFSGAAEARSLSLGGVISNLKDNFSTLLVAIGKPVFQNLTMAVSGLLGKFNDMMPVLMTIGTAIGTWLSSAISVANGLLFNFNDTIGTLLPSINQIGYVVQAVVSGDWSSAWWGAGQILSGALENITSYLSDFATGAMDWGYNFVTQIADGIVDAANSALQDAMNYVGDTISSFLEPGSPPKRGPLSTIDEWGAGIMSVFNDGMQAASDMPFIDGVLKAMLALQVAQNKVVSANKKVVGVQKEIADAEKEGFIPATLKEKLSLAEDGVKLAQEEVDFRKLQLQQQQELAKKSERGAADKGGDLNKASKSNDAMASASEKAAKAVKQTWQEAYADNLAQLEEKRRLGVVSEEEYLKDLLKLEKNYVDDALKEGVSAGLDEHVVKVKELQKELDALKPVKGTAGGLLGETFAFKQDPVDVIMGRFAAFPKKMGDIAAAGAEEFVANIQVRTKTVGESIPNTILGLIKSGWDKVREFVAGIPQEWIFPFSALMGVFAAPILEPLLESITKVGPALKWLIGNFSSFAGIIWRLSKVLLRFSVYGFIVYGLIINWDEVVAVATEIFGVLSATLGKLISNVYEFIDVLYQSGAAQEIISNVLGGISNLGLLATQIFGLLKKVAKAAILGVVVPALSTLSLFINGVIEKFGGIKPFTEKAIAAMLHLSKVFKTVVKNLTYAFQGVFQGNTQLIYQALEAVWADIKGLFAGENPASTFFENIVTSAKSVFAGLAAPIAAQIALLLTTVKTNLVQYWNSTVLPTISKWGVDIMAWAVAAYASIPSVLTKLINGISTFFETAWPTIYSALATWIPKVWSWVQQAALGAGVALNGLLLALSAWVSSPEGQASIVRLGENIGKFISDAISLIFKSGEGATSVIGTLLIALGAAAIQLAFIASEVGVNIVAGIFAGMMSKITGTEWKAATVNQFGTILQNIAKDLDTIVEHYFGEVGRSIIVGIISAFLPGEIIKNLRVTIETLVAETKKLLGISSPSTVFMAIGADIILGLIDGIKSMLSNLGGLAQSILSTITSAISGGGATPVAAPALDPQALIAQITTILSSLSPSITPYLNQLYTLIVNQFNSAQTEVINIMATMRLGIASTFYAMGSDTSDALDVLTKLTLDKLSLLQGQVVVIVKETTEKAYDVVHQFDWKSLGLYIDMGIAKGIEENRNLVIAKLAELISEAITQAKKDLGIQSPSVKFYELGILSMEGLTNGLQAGGDDTMHTIRNSMEKILKTAAKAWGGNGAKKAMGNFFHFYGTEFTAGMEQLAKNGNLTIASMEQLAKQVTGLSEIPKAQLDLLHKYGNDVIAEYNKVSKETKEAFAIDRLEKAAGLLQANDDILTKFNEKMTALGVSAATSLNDLVAIADMDIDTAKLEEMKAALDAGQSYGADIDAAIRDAFNAQDELNGALEEQKKMQEDLLKIEQARQKIDLMNQQLELAKMIQENNLNGAEIMNGLALGADASVADVTQAIARALEQLVAQAQTSLGISSPSTVFEKIGQQMMAGLNSGVLGSIKGVTANIGNVAGMLANSVPTGGAALNANGLDALGGANGPSQNNNFYTTIYDQMTDAVFAAKVLKVVGGQI